MCGRSLTWPALYVLAEGLELRLAYGWFLAEDDGTAETLRRSAQTLGLQLLAVILWPHTEREREMKERRVRRSKMGKKPPNQSFNFKKQRTN